LNYEAKSVYKEKNYWLVLTRTLLAGFKAPNDKNFARVVLAGASCLMSFCQDWKWLLRFGCFCFHAHKAFGVYKSFDFSIIITKAIIIGLVSKKITTGHSNPLDLCKGGSGGEGSVLG
jgi:hypothetical protein